MAAHPTHLLRDRRDIALDTLCGCVIRDEVERMGDAVVEGVKDRARDAELRQAPDGTDARPLHRLVNGE